MNKGSSAEKASSLIGCGGFILVVAFISFFWVVEVHFLPKQEPPPLPQGVPHDVPFLPAASVIIRTDDQSFVASYDQEVKITVFFDERYSLKRLWSGSGARLVIKASGSDSEAVFTGETHSKRWDKIIIKIGSGTSRFTPWLKVNVPVKKEYHGKWVNATAEIDVSYPTPSGTFGFINKHDHLVRSFQFFVVSPDEYRLLEQHKKWQHYQEIKGEGWLRALIFVVFTLSGTLLLFWGCRQARRNEHRGKQANP